MQIVPISPTTKTLADALDRPNRLAAQRSSAFSHLRGNVETDQVLEEIRRMMSPVWVHTIVLALRSTDLELTCPGKLECVELAAGLTRFIAMAGGSWSVEQRKEWESAVMLELRELPFLLVAPALQEARRRVEFPGKLVPWIMDAIDPMYARIKAEKATYERLLEITA